MNFTGMPIARRTLLARVTRVAVAVVLAQTLTTTCLVSTALGAELIVGEEVFARPLIYNFGDVTLITRGTFTFGTIIRAENRDPTLLPPGNAAAVGATGTAIGGTNVDDGDLNYARGDRVSTVLKGFIDVDAKYKAFGLFVSGKAWTDFTLRNGDVPHGNVPNGYVANTPLSDDGFSRLGAFSGVELVQANVYGTFDADGQPLFARLGYQYIDWGSPGTILGGLEQINPIDNPARVRPGAIPEEVRIAIPAIFAKVGLSKNTNLEAFYQFRFRPNELLGCGTFASFADYASEGCDKVVVAPVTLTDAFAVNNGLFVKRAPDVDPRNGGQYGVGVTYLAEKVGLFGVYFANYHSRRLSVSVIKSPRASGIPFIPGDPDGQNGQYFIEYPEDVQVWGLSFRTRLPDQTGIFAEYTFRPNQTIQLATTDLLNAFVSNTAPTVLRADATATPPGGVYHGSDRLKMSQFGAGASKPFGNVLGGEFTLGAEVGIKYIHGLPDVAVRRYVRSDIYGLGPVNGVCFPPAIPTQCSFEGYATAFSWGYRLRATTYYANVVPGVNLTPSVTFAQDIKGWSYDAQFNQGRQLAIVALRADFKKNFFAEALWTPIWGGTYNVAKDRDFYALAVGATF
jgi:hypothetical protein